MKFTTLTSFFLSGLALAIAAPAQDSSASAPRFRFNSLTVGYSLSGRTDLERAKSYLGNLEIAHGEVGLSGKLPFSAKFILLYGLNYSVDTFDKQGLRVLPDQLEKATLNLGVTSKLNERWTMTVAVQPGYYGNLKASDSDAFNVPGALAFSYSSSPAWSWSFGMRADAFSRNPVLPAVGASWQISDSWNLSLGMPRTALSWRMTNALTLRALASFQGGGYRVKAPAAVRPGGEATLLDYQEIRGGLSLEWTLSPAFQLNLEAGSANYRRFDYHQLGYAIVSGADSKAGYFTAALTASF